MKNWSAPGAGVHDIPDVLKRCTVDEDTGCWVWTRGLNSQGQPSFRIPALGRTGTIGQLYAALIDEPPPGMNWIAHCGNLLCCRPHASHRWPGTKSQQMLASTPTKTMAQRANIARGKAANSRISNTHVAALRNGAMSTRDAADILGITVSYAWAIKVGRSRSFCKAPLAGSSVFTWGQRR